MQQWEYITIVQETGPLGRLVCFYPDGGESKVGKPDVKSLHQQLNYLGKQGYELVAAATSATNAGLYSRYWVLKHIVESDTYTQRGIVESDTYITKGWVQHE